MKNLHTLLKPFWNLLISIHIGKVIYYLISFEIHVLQEKSIPFSFFVHRSRPKSPNVNGDVPHKADLGPNSGPGGAHTEEEPRPHLTEEELKVLFIQLQHAY